MPDVLLGRPQREQRDQGEGHQAGEPEEPGPAHARLAKMPPGRTNIRTMKMTKAMT